MQEPTPWTQYPHLFILLPKSQTEFCQTVRYWRTLLIWHWWLCLSCSRDKLFPAFGFGAKLPPDYQVSSGTNQSQHHSTLCFHSQLRHFLSSNQSKDCFYWTTVFFPGCAPWVRPKLQPCQPLLPRYKHSNTVKAKLLFCNYGLHFTLLDVINVVSRINVVSSILVLLPV